jgi:ABC-type uncharacterized transport system substrate-binding protein
MVKTLRAWMTAGLFGVVIALLAPRQSSAQVEISPESSPNAEIAELSQLLLTEISRSVSGSSPKVRVAIGIAAFREALAADDDRPLVAAYVTSTDFHAALGMRARPPNVTAVFSNPDPVAQVALAQALLGRSTIGVFDTPASHSLVMRIAQLPIQAIEVAPGQSIESLLRKAASVDALIVLPDPAVLNRSNIGHVVRSLYQRRQVLIGYSAVLTRVGGLASVYASPQSGAREVARLVAVFEADGALPPPTFVRDLDVAVNAPLARSLNIALPPDAELRDAVASALEKVVP